MSENKDWLYWRGMAFFVCLLWSSQFPIIKHIFVLQPQLHASVYSAVRFTLASIILLPTYYSKLNDWNMIKGTLFVALSAVCAYVGQSVGMSMGTTADKSAFICSLTVVWVPLLQGALKRNFREQKWLPVILSIVGVAFLELEGSSEPTVGDMWSCLQPIGFGNAMVIMENMIKTLGKSSSSSKNDKGEKGLDDSGKSDILAIAGLRAMWIAMLCWIWAIFTGQRMETVTGLLDEPLIIRNLLYLGVFTTAGGWFLQTLIQARVKSQDFALILATEPIFATLMSFFVLENITVSWQDILGGALIVVACVVNEVDFTASSKQQIKVVDV